MIYIDVINSKECILFDTCYLFLIFFRVTHTYYSIHFFQKMEINNIGDKYYEKAHYFYYIIDRHKKDI